MNEFFDSEDKKNCHYICMTHSTINSFSFNYSKIIPTQSNTNNMSGRGMSDDEEDYATEFDRIVARYGEVVSGTDDVSGTEDDVSGTEGDSSGTEDGGESWRQRPSLGLSDFSGPGPAVAPARAPGRGRGRGRGRGGAARGGGASSAASSAKPRRSQSSSGSGRLSNSQVGKFLMHLVALDNGDYEPIAAFMEQHKKKISPNTLFHNGETFLTFAIKNQKQRLFDMLLVRGPVHLGKTNAKKQTPLDVAREVGDEYMIHVLENRQKQKKDEQNRKLKEAAQERRKRLKQERDAKIERGEIPAPEPKVSNDLISRFERTVEGGDVNAIMQMINDNENLTVNVKLPESRRIPLTYAVQHGNVALFDRLLAIEPPRAIQLNRRDGYDETATFVAASLGREDMFRALLDKNSQFGKTRSGANRETPFMAAARGGYMDIIKQLSISKSNQLRVSADGNTAMHYACEAGHEEIVDAFAGKKSGLRVLFQRNEAGVTPAEMAERSGHHRIAQKLQNIMNDHENVKTVIQDIIKDDDAKVLFYLWQIHSEFLNELTARARGGFLRAACREHSLNCLAFLLFAEGEVQDDDLAQSMKRKANIQMFAGRKGHLDCLELLTLDTAVSPGTRKPSVKTVERLINMVVSGQYDQARIMLRTYRFDLTAGGGSEMLARVAIEGDLNMLHLLIQHGVDVDTPILGKTALQNAVKSTLTGNKTDYSEPMDTLINQRVVYLLLAGASPDYDDEGTDTANFWLDVARYFNYSNYLERVREEAARAPEPAAAAAAAGAGGGGAGDAAADDEDENDIAYSSDEEDVGVMTRAQKQRLYNDPSSDGEPPAKKPRIAKAMLMAALNLTRSQLLHSNDIFLGDAMGSVSSKKKRDQAAAPPLFEAIANNDLKQFKNLARNMTSQQLNAVSYLGIPLVVMASIVDEPSFMKTLVRQGANIHRTVRKLDNMSTLHCAIVSNNNRVAQELLKHGLDANMCDKNGATPLHKACIVGNSVGTALLLANDASASVRTDDGNTPLSLARRFNHRACMRVFETASGKTRASKSSSSTRMPKSRMTTKTLHQACAEDDMQTVESLLNSGADMNQQNGKKETPLHVACTYGAKDCVRALLKHGADRNILDIHGDTPYQTARTYNHTTCKRLLLLS